MKRKRKNIIRKHKLTNSNLKPFFGDLPQDIIQHILCLLPVKTLIRFKCVCKSWLYLISNPQFINTHLHKSNNLYDHRLRLILIQYDNTIPYLKGRYSLKFLSIDIIDNSDAVVIDCPNIDALTLSIRIVGSCNGLVCFTLDKIGVFICNPSTKISKKLPPPSRIDFADRMVAQGFGYDRLNDDYKAVLIMSGSWKAIEVYSLKSNLWRNIGFFPHDWEIYNIISQAIYVNGILHWEVIIVDAKKKSRFIFSFDLGNGSCGEIIIPCFLNERCLSFFITPCLGVLDGCLSIFCHSKITDLKEIWVMKEYGIMDSWIKLYTISDSDHDNYPPLCITMTGEILLKGYNELVLYNPTNGASRDPNIGTNYFETYDALTYVESLVSPNIDDHEVPSPKSLLRVTMQAPRQEPPDMICKDKILVQSTVVPASTTDDDITSKMFVRDDGKYIEEAKLRVVLLSPPNSPILSPINAISKQGPLLKASEMNDNALLKHEGHSPDNQAQMTISKLTEERRWSGKERKEMCRLSCSVCDNMDAADAPPRRRPRFRNIDQLKGHLFHQHRTLMCSLCLEGRKVFICEQKLYTRAQLNQHIQTGDSEVDGTESERGGFMGHPICEFCKNPFYGENELFSHMSTEHFTCHICRRQHPGQYDYFKNYDDLENHFRGEHFLCEDEACLAKKFIVFTSEAEIKRHNAMEHGGSMSRSKRNAALQIPTSFRYHRGSEQSIRRGRANRTFHRDYSKDQLPSSYEASYEPANNDVDQLVQPLESLTTTDSARYMLAVSSLTSRNAPLEDSSFPPLPAAPPKKSKNGTEKLNSSMASHLRQKNNVNAGVKRSPQLSTSSSSTKPVSAKFSSNCFPELCASSSTGPINNKFSSNDEFPGLSAKPSSNAFPELPVKNKTVISSNTVASARLPASYSCLAKTVGTSSSRIHHSTSAPNLATRASVDTNSTSDFPPVSVAAAQVRKIPTNGQSIIPKVEDVQTANKSLVERIRSALDFDEDKYTTFKLISGEYRQGMIDAETYLSYVDQFGLIHLLLELASLCPDPERQKILISTYNANMRSDSSGTSSKKGKGKLDNSSKDKLADSVINTVRKLQSNFKPSEENAEVLSKDGYRDSKGKGKVMVDTSSQPLDTNLGDSGGTGKKQKKTSKFHRVRLGDGSVEALLDIKKSDPDLIVEEREAASDGVATRGAWRNGGGQKLVAKTSKGQKK